MEFVILCIEQLLNANKTKDLSIKREVMEWKDF